MADTVFYIYSKLGECLIIAVGAENRVVAKAVITDTTASDFTVDTPFKLAQPFHPKEKKIHIVIARGVFASEARGVDARKSTERIDKQACVVGKTVATVARRDVFHLLSRIFLKGGARFGYVVVTADVGKRQDADSVAHDSSQFRQFMGVVCCENDFFHNRVFKIYWQPIKHEYLLAAH